MSRPKPGTRSASTPRRILFWAIPIALAWLGFRLFEPVLVWSSGWKPLPKSSVKEEPTAATEFVDADWIALQPPVAARFREAYDELETPALSAAISIDGRRVWAGVIGLAEVETTTPATLTSSFRLGSTSKAVTS